MDNTFYYIILLVAIIAVVIIIKRVTGCIFRTITAIVFLAILLWCLHSLGIL